MTQTEDHNYVLTDLQQAHLTEVAQIHRAQLNDDFCACLGQGFLESVFYAHFVKQPGGVGLVALDGERRVVGFVIAHAAQGYYSRFISRHFISMGLYAIMALIRQPRILPYMVDVVRVLFSRETFQPDETDAELLYIAVSEGYQGQSIGSRLTRALLEGLSNLPYDRCVVKTLLSTPENIRFYERNEFSVVKTALGRVWLACILDQESSKKASGDKGNE